jgi:hypothetical protein
MLVAGEGEEAGGPADRKAFGDDVAIVIAGELEHDIAAGRHGAEQPSRQVRMIARYERGVCRLRIGFSIVDACGRIQENQCRRIRSIGNLRDRNVLGERFDVLQEDDVAQWLTFQPTHDLDQLVCFGRHLCTYQMLARP